MVGTACKKKGDGSTNVVFTVMFSDLAKDPDISLSPWAILANDKIPKKNLENLTRAQ